MIRKALDFLGVGLVFAAAVVASFSTLAELAKAAGWDDRAAWLLPTCLDALGMAAARVWMSPGKPAAARSFARRLTLLAVVLSVAGNAAGHMVASGYVRPGLLVVMLVGAVPPASLAAVVHLVVLTRGPVPARRAKVAAVAPEPVTAPAPPKVAQPVARKAKPTAKRQPQGDWVPDELTMQKARHADTEHRATNDGKPITRDALKKALHLSSDRASKVYAVLTQERAGAVA